MLKNNPQAVTALSNSGELNLLAEAEVQLPRFENTIKSPNSMLNNAKLPDELPVAQPDLENLQQ